MDMTGKRRRYGDLRIAWSGICAALSVSGCVKHPPADVATRDASSSQSTELDWAREALNRNPTLELVAADEGTGIFTVREKETGAVYAVRANELAAVPVFALRVAQRNASRESQTPTLPPSSPATAPGPQTAATDLDGTVASNETAQPTTPSYTIERADGRIKVSGPGISIVSSGAAAVTPTEGSDQRSAEPIICEGRRMLHLNDRNIYVDGNAIVARGGCELFVTNSRIGASGTGIVIEDATVHISNSTIAGDVASFEAGDEAKVFIRSSTFEGLSRRAERAVVQDQGGNQWR
jgi:hypothetical protein